MDEIGSLLSSVKLDTHFVRRVDSLIKSHAVL